MEIHLQVPLSFTDQKQRRLPDLASLHAFGSENGYPSVVAVLALWNQLKLKGEAILKATDDSLLLSIEEKAEHVSLYSVLKICRIELEQLNLHSSTLLTAADSLKTMMKDLKRY